MSKLTSFTLQQLRDLAAVVAHGGFRPAARAIDVPQAGLTKSVARLEAVHGVPLLERTPKGTKLTSRGEGFFRHVKVLLDEAAQAEKCLTRKRNAAVTQVALGVSVEPSLGFVPAVLVDYRRAMPHVTLHLKQSVGSELLMAVRENRLEFAVTRLPIRFDSHDLQVRPLRESESSIMARRDHPCLSARRLGDLSGQEWVVLGHRGSGAGEGGDETIATVFAAQHLPSPRIAAVTNSLFGALSMVLDSDCLIRLPKVVLRHPMVNGQLVAIALDEARRQSRIAIVHKASHQLSREAQTLASMLASYVRVSRALPA